MGTNSSSRWIEITSLTIAVTIASIISEYVRTIFFYHQRFSLVELEPLMIFILWILFIWWVAKRYSGGFSLNWFIFALLFFSLIADALESSIGGSLG